MIEFLTIKKIQDMKSLKSISAFFQRHDLQCEINLSKNDVFGKNPHILASDIKKIRDFLDLKLEELNKEIQHYTSFDNGNANYINDITITKNIIQSTIVSLPPIPIAGVDENAWYVWC